MVSAGQSSNQACNGASVVGLVYSNPVAHARDVFGAHALCCLWCWGGWVLIVEHQVPRPVRRLSGGAPYAPSNQVLGKIGRVDCAVLSNVLCFAHWASCTSSWFSRLTVSVSVAAADWAQ